MKAAKLILLLILASLLLLGLAARFTARAPALDPASRSAQYLQPGTYAVGYQEVRLLDRERPTVANGDFPGSPHRELLTAVWFPLADNGSDVAAGQHPLIVHSHGFSSNRREGDYLARQLASQGYMVLSADFPLTHMQAPGGPQFADVLNQPGDVSFLIGMALKWNQAHGHMFHQRIDADRIGAMGLSLGGMTTTLAAFHPQLRDPRIRAAVSIAGPSMMFGPSYFQQAGTPFLMIAGDIDALVPYPRNAAPLPEKAPEALLLTLTGGSHTGFAGMARWLRWLRNPDSIGCFVVKRSGVERSNPDFYQRLGGEEMGIIADMRSDLCIIDPLPPAMNVLRQQQLTTLAIQAFFESHFASDTATRTQHWKFLTRTLPAEQADVQIHGRH